MSGLVWPLIGEEVHGIGVLDASGSSLEKDDFRVYLLQDLPQDPVCAVTDAGFCTGSRKDDFDAVGLWMLRKKQPGGPLRSHGVGAEDHGQFYKYREWISYLRPPYR